jgi:hypothetical protein
MIDVMSQECTRNKDQQVLVKIFRNATQFKAVYIVNCLLLDYSHIPHRLKWVAKIVLFIYGRPDQVIGSMFKPLNRFPVNLQQIRNYYLIWFKHISSCTAWINIQMIYCLHLMQERELYLQVRRCWVSMYPNATTISTTSEKYSQPAS